MFIDTSKECVKVTNHNKLYSLEVINLVKRNAEIKEIAAREQVLRDEINKRIAEIEVG